MRILVLTPTSPVPTDAGNKTLTAGLLHYLTRHHECDLVAVEDPSRDPEQLKGMLGEAFPGLRHIEVFPTLPARRRRLMQLAALTRQKHPALVRFHSPELVSWLRAQHLDSLYDVAHFDMIRMAQYRRWCAHLPSVLVGSDAYSLAARRGRLALPPRSYAEVAGSLLQETLFRRYERTRYGRFDILAMVGQPDAAYIQRLCPGLDVRLIGIPLPTAFEQAPVRAFPTQPGQPRVLVTGSLGHPGVAYGVRTFLEECRGYMTNAPRGAVTVLGKDPHPLLASSIQQLPYVEHIQFVEDYAAFLNQDWVYVYPQQCGTGLQTKVQQAMAVGLPTVGYPVSYGGLRIHAGTHAFACATPEELHRSVRRLLADSSLRQQIGCAAAAHVRRTFSIDAVGAEVAQLYVEAIANQQHVPHA